MPAPIDGLDFPPARPTPPTTGTGVQKPVSRVEYRVKTQSHSEQELEAWLNAWADEGFRLVSSGGNRDRVFFVMERERS